MPNVQDTFIARSYDAIFAHTGVAAVYHRISGGGGEASDQITVARARSVFELVDESGFTSQLFVRDFLIRAGDLLVGGQLITPAPGDVVELLNDSGGGSDMYVIVPPNSIEPAWRWSDPAHTIARVHTKLIDAG